MLFICSSLTFVYVQHSTPQVIYCPSTAGVLLPNEETLLTFSFLTQKPGVCPTSSWDELISHSFQVFKQQFDFVTTPLLPGRTSLTVRCLGIAEDTNQEGRYAVEEHLRRNQCVLISANSRIECIVAFSHGLLVSFCIAACCIWLRRLPN